jgi:TP901 family phage tail tape measure protein
MARAGAKAEAKNSPAPSKSYDEMTAEELSEAQLRRVREEGAAREARVRKQAESMAEAVSQMGPDQGMTDPIRNELMRRLKAISVSESPQLEVNDLDAIAKTLDLQRSLIEISKEMAQLPQAEGMAKAELDRKKQIIEEHEIELKKKRNYSEKDLEELAKSDLKAKKANADIAEAKAANMARELEAETSRKELANKQQEYLQKTKYDEMTGETLMQASMRSRVMQEEADAIMAQARSLYADDFAEAAAAMANLKTSQLKDPKYLAYLEQQRNNALLQSTARANMMSDPRWAQEELRRKKLENDKLEWQSRHGWTSGYGGGGGFGGGGGGNGYSYNGIFGGGNMGGGYGRAKGMLYGMKNMAWSGLAPLVGAGSIFAILKTAIQSLKDYETGLANINRVFDGTNQELEQLGTSMTRVAIQYGDTVASVAQIQEEWAKAGRSTYEEISDLTKVTELTLKTSDITDSAKAVEYLNSSMVQMGLSTEEALPLLDSWNKVADSSTANTQDLAEAYEKTASYAKNLGLSTDDLNSIISLLIQRTGKSGSEIGSSLQMIFSNLLRPKSIETLKEMGIEIRQLDEYGKPLEGRYKPFIEIMNDISAKAKEFSGQVGADNEYGISANLMKLATALGESRRRSVAISLFEGWDDFDMYKSLSESSGGYSQYKNELMEDTLTRKSAQFKAALQELAVTIGETGLTDALKSFMSVGTDIISWFDSLDPRMRTLVTYGTTITGILTGIQLLSQKLTGDKLGLFGSIGQEAISKLGGKDMATKVFDKMMARTDLFEAAGGKGSYADLVIKSMSEMNLAVDEAMVKKYGLVTAEQAAQAAQTASAATTQAQTVATGVNNTVIATSSAELAANTTAQTVNTAAKRAATLSSLALNAAMTIGISLLITGITYMIRYKEAQRQATKEDIERTNTLLSESKRLDSLYAKNLELVNTIDKLKKAQAEQSRQYDDLNNRSSQDLGLIEERDQAQNKLNNTTSQLSGTEAELVQVQKDIASILPSTTASFDELGNAKADDLELTKKQIQANKDYLRSEIETKATLYELRKSALEQDMSEARATAEMNKQLYMSSLKNNDWESTNTDVAQTSVNPETYKKKWEEAEEEFLDLQAEFDMYKTAYNLRFTLDYDPGQLSDTVKEAISKANQIAGSLSVTTGDATAFTSDTFSRAEKYLNVLASKKSAANKAPAYSGLADMFPELEAEAKKHNKKLKDLSLSTIIDIVETSLEERRKEYVASLELKKQEAKESLKILREEIQARRSMLNAARYARNNNLSIPESGRLHLDAQIEQYEKDLGTLETAATNVMDSIDAMSEAMLDSLDSFDFSGIASSTKYEELDKTLSILEGKYQNLQSMVELLDSTWQDDADNTAYVTEKKQALLKVEEALRTVTNKTASYLGSVKDDPEKFNELTQKLYGYKTAMVELKRTMAELNRVDYNRVFTDTAETIEAIKNNAEILNETSAGLDYSKFKAYVQLSQYKNVAKELTQQMKAVKAEIDRVNTSINSTTDAPTKAGLLEYMDELEKKLQEVDKATIENHNDLRDFVVNALKGGYQVELDRINETLEYQMSLEEKRHDDFVKNKEEELRILEEQWEKEDKTDAIAEIDKEIASLTKKRDSLNGDTSQYAAKLRKEYQEQIDEQIKAKNEELKQQDRDRQRDAIQDAIDADTEAYEDKMDLLKDEESAVEKHYKTLIDNAEFYGEGLIKAYEKNQFDIIKMLYKMIPSYELAGKAAMAAYNTGLSGKNAAPSYYNQNSLTSPNMKHEYGMSHEDYVDFISNGLRATELMREGHKKGEGGELDDLIKENNTLRTKYKIPDGKYPSFKYGGIMPYDGFAELHANEMILPPKYGKVIEDLSDLIQVSPSSSVRELLANTSEVNVEVKEALHIDNAYFGDELDYESVEVIAGNSLKNSLYKKGIKVPR